MTARTVDTHDLVDLQLTLDWESAQGAHREIHHFNNYNIWRDLDLLPFGLQGEILHQPAGHVGTVELASGEVVPGYQEQLLHQVKKHHFNQHYRNREVTPRAGRFYPQGIVENLPGVFPGSINPLRLTRVNGESLTCDLNPPLAGYQLKLTSQVNNIHGAPDEHGGRCQDALEQMLHGPGMQIRASGNATDFLSGEPFRRMDQSQDDIFYSMSRLTDHLDSRALSEIKQLYTNLIPQGAKVLDLMSSVNSHLPENSVASVTGLGMNQEELDANPLLSERLVHDLNSNPQLPFADTSFDAVVCTVSVEYLTRPLEVFQEVARVLKPGGVFINSFSNRWFPPKVIDLWIDLHEYERMGLVSEYYLLSDAFGKVNTWTQQGLSRPEDDSYAGQSATSDPLYAVWSEKI